jgi:hypothetical protein
MHVHSLLDTVHGMGQGTWGHVLAHRHQHVISVATLCNVHGLCHFSDFNIAMLDEVHGGPKSMLTSMYKSMPKRLAPAMTKEGDKIIH